MKQLIVMAGLAGLATLAACSKPAPEPTPTETATTAALPNGSGPGTYLATTKDGTVTTATLGADGKYTDTSSDGKVVEEGTWAVTGGKTCFTPTTKGATAMCYTVGTPAADGSFTVTPDKGDPEKVVPQAATAPDAAGTDAD